MIAHHPCRFAADIVVLKACSVDAYADRSIGPKDWTTVATKNICWIPEAERCVVLHL